MSFFHVNAIHGLVSSTTLMLALLAATGCPGNEEQPPVAEDDTGPSSDTEPAVTSTGTTGPGDATVDDTGVDTETGGEQCEEEPTDPVGLLNGCTDATCEPFANTPERLPRLGADGSLPPLP